MAILNGTTIEGTLTLAKEGYIKLHSCSGSWLNGFSNAPILCPDAENNSSYYPWIAQKNTSSNIMVTVGTYQNYFVIAGSTTSRTANGYDNALFFNMSNGHLSLNNKYLYLHSNNYKDYAPTKTGSGASGTWGINISGNAASLSSTLPISKGGTNSTSFTSNRLLYYNGSKVASASSLVVGSGQIEARTSGETTARFYVQNNNNTADLRVTKNAGVYHSNAKGSSNAKWLIYINTSGVVTANTSDRRKKKYINDTTEYEAVSILKNIKIRNFIYKEDIGHNNLIQNGIFAQDLRDIMKQYNISNRPWLQWHYNNDDNVYYNINEPETDNMTYEINYSSLVPLLIKGWQINENKISQLKDKIKELEEM